MQAIILAGGFGERLRSVVSDVPKPMAPIGEKPFLAMLVEYLSFNGFTEVILSVHYKREAVKEFFGDRYCDVVIKYAVEESPLGTGGAIVNSLNVLNPDNPVVVFNGDTFAKVDLNEMYQQHLENDAELTIALRHIDDCSRYGQVLFENGIINEFASSGNKGEGYINAGVYVVNPALFDNFSLNDSFSFESDFLYKYTSQIKPRSFLADDYFIDIGIPDDYKRACNELPLIMRK